MLIIHNLNSRKCDFNPALMRIVEVLQNNCKCNNYGCLNFISCRDFYYFYLIFKVSYFTRRIVILILKSNEKQLHYVDIVFFVKI